MCEIFDQSYFPISGKEYKRHTRKTKTKLERFYLILMLHMLRKLISSDSIHFKHTILFIWLLFLLMPKVMLRAFCGIIGYFLSSRITCQWKTGVANEMTVQRATSRLVIKLYVESK